MLERKKKAFLQMEQPTAAGVSLKCDSWTVSFDVLDRDDFTFQVPFGIFWRFIYLLGIIICGLHTSIHRSLLFFLCVWGGALQNELKWLNILPSNTCLTWLSCSAIIVWGSHPKVRITKMFSCKFLLAVLRGSKIKFLEISPHLWFQLRAIQVWLI